MTETSGAPSTRSVFKSWEILRIVYNAVLVFESLVVYLWFSADLPFIGLLQIAVPCLLAANVCYLLGPAVEVALRRLGWFGIWVRYTLFTSGLLASVWTVLLLVVLSVAFVVVDLHELRTDWKPSPSGRFNVAASVNRTSGHPDYADVRLHLADADGREVTTWVSRAGDANKWALGWMPHSDVIVLQSSDVGTMAFRVTPPSAVEEIEDITRGISTRADELKELKYGARSRRR